MHFGYKITPTLPAFAHPPTTTTHKVNSGILVTLVTLHGVNSGVAVTLVTHQAAKLTCHDVLSPSSVIKHDTRRSARQSACKIMIVCPPRRLVKGSIADPNNHDCISCRSLHKRRESAALHVHLPVSLAVLCILVSFQRW